MSRTILSAAALVSLMGWANPALAAPGLGEEIYGARVAPGELELEAIYGQLAEGADDGEDTLRLEAAYAPSDRFRIGVKTELERESGASREVEALGIEAIYALGRLGGIDVALYGEYEIGLEGPDAIETKLLLQRSVGPFDARLNLIAEKELGHAGAVELGYAASADVAAFGEVRLGAAAFGELGTTRDFLPSAEHYAGPVAKFEVEGLGPELEIEAGYLFALGRARDDADGQFRLKLELEF